MSVCAARPIECSAWMLVGTAAAWSSSGISGTVSLSMATTTW